MHAATGIRQEVRAWRHASQVHVTGYCIRKASDFDMTTSLYDSSGRRLWQRFYSTPGTENGVALAIDSSRCTYVCGTGTPGNIVVVKYGTGGATLWSTTHPNPARYPDEIDSGSGWPKDITVAGDSAYVVGSRSADYGDHVARDFLMLASWR